ncbi:hypothetical protein C9I86_16680 [Photobacterium sp. NCIMB 13483]|uniref:CDP-glycerol glycerophosphotransferase family protein n=1 Tax=Photobacterium sp. NCIMB 13483 TaxID=2022103 RepID=UPI000D15C058|nr:CDP-glycerol glycerophosphotransferase family protein [Photobacterium sp. NCIMB 13483]PST85870.1 hypothetical protein C9I86_16680 [Photobacterium sp. NCIMB 13483]
MKKLLFYIFKVPMFLIVSLIPKQKKIWIFGAWFGNSISDNPKYLYQYLRDNNPEIKPIWITKNRSLLNNDDGFDTYYYKSIKGIYYQIFASMALVTHSIATDFNSPFIGLNTKRVLLWHGAPLKKIGYDDEKYTTKNYIAKKYHRLFSFLTNNIYNYVISNGDICSKSFLTAFNLKNENILLTGFPRNDVFSNRSYANDKKLKAIYMPTFRGAIGEEVDLFVRYGFDISLIDEVLTNSNIELTIRVHPANSPSSELSNKISLSKSIRTSLASDVYEEINDYDVLITDYSSIMFDFAITKRPIIFAPFDIEQYLLNDRELYIKYDDIVGDDFSRNWNDILNKLLELKSNPNEFYFDSLVYKYHDEKLKEEKMFSAKLTKILTNLKDS